MKCINNIIENLKTYITKKALREKCKVFQQKALANRNKGMIFFISLLLVIIMRDEVSMILNKFWVVPVMSEIYNNSGLYFVFAIISILLYYIMSFLTERYKSKTRLNITIITSVLFILTLLYTYFETGKGWIYSSLSKTSSCFLYYHSTLIFLLIYGGELFLHFKRKRREEPKATSLIYETPIKNKVDDLYKRNNYCSTIAAKVVNNFHKEGSFVIGISGEWGAGKTSFINLIKNELEGKEIDIIFDFKPWLSSSSNNITIDFFSQLYEELSIYIPGLKNDFASYIDSITDMDVEPIYKGAIHLIRHGLSKSSESKYQRIKDVLEVSKLKVLIFIDDTDRLSEEEMLEVFKIMRNTANFPYVQFIITYDRKYVISSLDMPNPEKYLQKIFNLEVVLPVFESYIIRESLYNELVRNVDINLANDAGAFLLISASNNDYPLEEILVSRRDVIRFVNSFIIAVDAIGDLGNLSIKDLIKIELLRYYDMEFYSQLSKRPTSLLSVSSDSYVYEYKAESNSKTLDESEDNTDINLSNYRSGIDRQVIYSCMISLFPEKEVKNRDAISKLRAFDQYFRYRYDEDNITENEIVLLLNEKDKIEQQAQIESLFINKKSNEVYNMMSYVVLQVNTKSLEDKQSPYHYEKLLSLLNTILDCKNELLRNECLEASYSIFKRSSYIGIDQYIKFLSIWDRSLSFLHSGEHVSVLDGFMIKKNLQKKVRKELHSDEVKKIEVLLLDSNSPEQMSDLLDSLFDIDIEDNSDLTISESRIKEIQLSYFVDYANKYNKIDFACLELFNSSAIIESGSKHLIWPDKASETMRILVDRDPNGYLDEYISEINTYATMPLFWESAFAENDDDIERYLYDNEKDHLPKIDIARIAWQLFKHNDYNALALNNKDWEGLPSKVIFEKYDRKLKELLDIQKKIEVFAKQNVTAGLDEDKLKELIILEGSLNKISFPINLVSRLHSKIKIEKEKLLGHR